MHVAECMMCRHTEPNFSLPWQRERQYSSSSSGFAVAFGEPDAHGRHPRWLLTNGHAVEYHSQVCMHAHFREDFRRPVV